MGALSDRQLRELYDRSGAAQWKLPMEQFQAAIERSAAHASGDDPTAANDRRHDFDTGYVEDLALAAACEAGLEAAWEHFVHAYRPLLYRAAEAIDRSGGARELADSLYAELYGIRERDSARTSLFRYFHGRSSLATWLRAVLAQRFVDGIRRRRREEPLIEADVETPATKLAPLDEEHPRFADAMRCTLEHAVAQLQPRDRLRLRAYYVQNLTLADIGALLNEHEATVSRHLARTRKDIRRAVEAELRSTHRFDEAAIRQCFAAVVADPGTLDLAQLVGAAPLRKPDVPDRSEL
jgi:RNA polymerase sigma factor (sigma-70 family)